MSGQAFSLHQTFNAASHQPSLDNNNNNGSRSLVSTKSSYIFQQSCSRHQALNRDVFTEEQCWMERVRKFVVEDATVDEDSILSWEQFFLIQVEDDIKAYSQALTSD